MKSLLDIQRFKLYAWVGLAIFCMCVIHETLQPKAFLRAFFNMLWLTVYLTGVNYLLFEYTVPRLRWKKFFPGLLWIVLYIFLFTWGLHQWAALGYLLGVNTEYILPPSHRLSQETAFSAATIFLFGIVRHIYLHIRLKQSAQQLRIEKQQAELNYLKSQTNPHFLFNTLNNIYSLARDKSDQAPESILKLSQILRYMLYEAGGQYVSIEQELKIIGDYIALEQLRYDESLRINFNYDVEDMKQALPPLLLIPLVENAFKHGVSETRHRPFIDIHLSVAKRQLSFFVKNSMGEVVANGKVKENIGLTNLRRQLELLYTDYEVSVEQRVSEFSATLKINLASHV